MATKFILSLLYRIVPLSAAFLFTVYSDSANVKMGAYLAGIVILVCGEYALIFRPLVNWEEHKYKLLDHYIKQFVESAVLNRKRIMVRANVMLVKWSWSGRYFYQYYQCGMAGHADANLYLPISKGFCGKIFKGRTHAVEVVDLRGHSIDQLQQKFKLSKQEAEMTSRLKAIACIPLYREVKTIRGTPKTVFYGVLNVDTLENDGVTFLETAPIKTQIKGLAGFAQLTLN